MTVFMTISTEYPYDFVVDGCSWIADIKNWGKIESNQSKKAVGLCYNDE